MRFVFESKNYCPDLVLQKCDLVDQGLSPSPGAG